MTLRSILPTPAQQRDRSSKVTGNSGDGNETETSGTRNSQAKQISTTETSNPVVQTPSVLSTPVAATLQDNSGPSTGKGGGAQRSIDQIFQLNPSSGTFSLSIPIRISKARREFQPTLELSYDSGSGNGPFGLGWRLSGGEISITRKTSKGIPKYEDTAGTESDIFILSGVEDLVVADESPDRTRTLQGQTYDVKRYRPRVESDFRIIERWTNLRDVGDVFWRTLSSSNGVQFFGRTDHSRVYEKLATGNKRIFTWLLSESYDPFGNSIAYVYKAENDDGVQALPVDRQTCEIGRDNPGRTRARYLKSIKYGNRRPSRDLDSWDIVPRSVLEVGDVSKEWMFEVVLDYGEHDPDTPTTDSTQAWTVRNDPFSTYRSGFEIRSYRQCRRILMFHHLPEKMGLQDYLVSSYTMEYDSDGSGSFLKSVIRQGHIWNPEAGKYDCLSLPPFTLTYSSIPDPEKLQMQSLKPKLLSQLAASRTIGGQGIKAQWIDLNGEGTSGLLVQINGTWYYNRNESLLMDVMSEEGELTDDSSSVASISESKTDFGTPDGFGTVNLISRHPTDRAEGTNYFTDLDGNGRQNLVTVDNSGRLIGYHERIDDDDWTNFKEFDSVLSLDEATIDKRSPIRKFDVTGNGLVDVVRLDHSDGQVLWHESLGKRGFAPERRARGSGKPVFWNYPNQRLSTTLADMTGDGLTDIVQLSNGQVSYWPNLGYGHFGAEIVMNNPPIFDKDAETFNPYRILLADVDGNGATDLVYLPDEGGAVIYRNLCGNGFSEGRHVPCFPRVSDPTSIFVMDLLGKGTSCLCRMDVDSTNEMVIQYLDLNSPTRSFTSKPNMLMSFENGVGLRTSVDYWPSTKFYLKDERGGQQWKSKLPFPVHVVRKIVHEDLITASSKTFKYHYRDGYFDGQDREFRGFGMVEEWTNEVIALGNGNRYQKPTSHKKLWYHTGAMTTGLSPDAAFTSGKTQVVSKLPTGLSPAGSYESFRALKGKELRSELYGLDGTAKTRLPYAVTEKSYRVIQEQPPPSAQFPGVFKIHPLETLTTNYERVASNPRILHEIILERNDFGDVVKALDIRYGSKKSPLAGKSQTAQRRSEVTYTEVEYTNAIVGSKDLYKPLVAGISKSRILGFASDHILDLETVTYSDAADKTIVRYKTTKTIYRSKDMTQPLKYQVQEPFSVVHQVFELVLEKSRQLKVYGPSDNVVVQPGHTCESILDDIGEFTDLDDDGNWWAPSSLSFFGGSLSKSLQLSAARQSFFSPNLTVDPFGNQTQVEMDIWSLLPCKWTDAVGGVVKAENDYRVLSPVTIWDTNENQSSIRVDALGRTTASAQLGKEGNTTGESLDGLASDLELEDMVTFFKKPTRQQAKKLLGKAGKRWIFGLQREMGQDKPTPMFQIALFRTSDEDDAEPMFTISYFSGYSQAIQDVGLATWEDSPERWRFSGSASFDSDAKPVQTLPQFHGSTHFFVPHASIASPSKMTFYDALGRSVGELNQDHSWTKTCYDDAWSTREFTTEDTVLVQDPREDPDIGRHFQTLSTSSFLPSWQEQQIKSGNKSQVEAAKKSERFANTPMITHIDTSGRVLARVFTDGTITRTTSLGYDIENMDSGTQVMFYDCLGEVTLSKDSRGVSRRYVRDYLRRITETYVLEVGETKEILWSKIIFGDNLPLSEEPKVLRNNQKGRIVRVYDQSGVRTSDTYDPRGNCTRSTTQLAAEYKSSFNCSPDMGLESEVWTTTAVFDAMSRECQAVDAVGTCTRRKFNLLSGLDQVLTSEKTDPDKWSSCVTKIDYTADGLVSTLRLGNGSETVFVYDEATRQLLNKRTQRTSDGKTLEDIKYTYDSAGRISHEEDLAQEVVYFRNQRIDASRDFAYDGFGRLLMCTGREMINTDSTSPSHSSPMSLVMARECGISTTAMQPGQLTRYTELYEYDSVDNIVKVAHQTDDDKTANWTRTYEYTDLSKSNRLASTKVQGKEERYEYNKTGCITSMSGYSKVGWDALGRLKSSSQQKLNKDPGDEEEDTNQKMPERTWFVYNDEGARVRKVTDRSTVDASEQPRRLKETMYLDSCDIYRKYTGESSDSVSSKPEVETHTSLIKESPDAQNALVVAEKNMSKGDEAPWLLRWTLSPGLEVDDQSRIVSYEEYTPFGLPTYQLRGSGIEAPSRYRFATYLRDHETGLHYCQARYYCPWLGRWMSPDPLDTIDGLNLYCYVANDPVNWVDPTGT
ncbi:SpvB-domain-containing protein, partial [Colletotrichum sublineola]